MISSRAELRRIVRMRRRSITKRQRAVAARNFASGADRDRILRPGRRIAIYQPHGYEADVSELMRRAFARGCSLYLPVITHFRQARMQFVHVRPGMSLRKNRHGIAEPIFCARDVVSVRALDVVFMPVVAFDDDGWRLGSGAGYYDRCFRHLARERCWRRPRLIGVAYELQRVQSVQPSHWDVPMHAVLTETRLISFKNRHARRTS